MQVILNSLSTPSHPKKKTPNQPLTPSPPQMTCCAQLVLQTTFLRPGNFFLWRIHGTFVYLEKHALKKSNHLGYDGKTTAISSVANQMNRFLWRDLHQIACLERTTSKWDLGRKISNVWGEYEGLHIVLTCLITYYRRFKPVTQLPLVGVKELELHHPKKVTSRISRIISYSYSYH